MDSEGPSRECFKQVWSVNTLSYSYPKIIQELTVLLKRFPGVGARSAERMALGMLEWPDDALSVLSERIGELKERIHPCQRCGNICDSDFCSICSDPKRDPALLCVVESSSQIPVIERSASYRGVYCVLGGKLAPLEGKGPESLDMENLMILASDGEVREVILATSPDVEGEATAAYLAEELQEFDVTVSRIAAGIPVGADMSCADSPTMAMAINSRRKMR